MLKSSLTEPDNLTLDFFRIGTVLGIFVFLGLATAGWWTGKPFDGVNFGTGYGLLLGAAAGAMRLRP